MAPQAVRASRPVESSLHGRKYLPIWEGQAASLVECPFPAGELKAKAVRKGCLWFFWVRPKGAAIYRIQSFAGKRYALMSAFGDGRCHRERPKSCRKLTLSDWRANVYFAPNPDLNPRRHAQRLCAIPYEPVV